MARIKGAVNAKKKKNKVLKLAKGYRGARSKQYRIANIQQDYTLTAQFEKQGTVTYEVSSGVATTGGSISPSGKIYAANGAAHAGHQKKK